jgi:perosamine synthetase
MNQIRSFGEKEVWGSNYSLSRVQAAIGISQLSKLDKLNEKRIKVANQRTNILSKYSYFYLPQYEIFDKPIYTYYNIVFKEDYNDSFRDEVRKILLNKYNIETSIANEPTYKIHKFIEKNIRKIDNNVSKNLGERIINLPIHYAMSRKDNIYICESFIKTIREVLKNGK